MTTNNANAVSMHGVDELVNQVDEAEGPFIEFFRRDSLSMGMYCLESEDVDSQKVHQEDEVYYVVLGSAKIEIFDKVLEIEAGDIVYVENGSDHHFFDIEDILITVVFFAPALTG